MPANKTAYIASQLLCASRKLFTLDMAFYRTRFLLLPQRRFRFNDVADEVIQLLKGNRAQGNLHSHDMRLNNFPILAVKLRKLRRRRSTHVAILS